MRPRKMESQNLGRHRAACAVTHAMHYAAYGGAPVSGAWQSCDNRSDLVDHPRPPQHGAHRRACKAPPLPAVQKLLRLSQALAAAGKCPCTSVLASAAPRPMQAPDERLSPHPQQAASARTATGNEACRGPWRCPLVYKQPRPMALASRSQRPKSPAERPSSLSSRL